MTAKDRYLQAVAKDLRRKEGRQVTEVSEKHRAVARAVLRRNTPIVHALIAAGYSSAQASKGMHVVRRVYGLRTAFQEEGEKIAREKEVEAKQMQLADPWVRREEAIVNLLESNIRAKRDRAVGSAKLLGSHKRLSLWEPEFKSGIVILNAPAGAPLVSTDELPIDDEVIELSETKRERDSERDSANQDAE